VRLAHEAEVTARVLDRPARRAQPRLELAHALLRQRTPLPERRRLGRHDPLAQPRRLADRAVDPGVVLAQPGRQPGDELADVDAPRREMHAVRRQASLAILHLGAHRPEPLRTDRPRLRDVLGLRAPDLLMRLPELALGIRQRPWHRRPRLNAGVMLQHRRGLALHLWDGCRVGLRRALDREAITTARDRWTSPRSTAPWIPRRLTACVGFR
jgi:hypothetical protein